MAIATACDNLVSGSCDIALAGGVNVMAGPAMQIMTAQVGMLSPLGRCFTFDHRANGIVNGEGVGVVMLKRLADAQRDRDCIYGVVEGWGVNQDGKTNGITAPNADSQARLQQSVYERFGIDPAGIQLIEAHGTGTALGDPIEVAALKASFAKYTRDQDYCALGSVKSNIGHCLTAAGVSGVLKILLALKHQQLPPTIHFSTLNPHISLHGSPFYVNDRLREWRRHGSDRRRAAVNSFGFGGTNAHLVIAESLEGQDVVADPAPAIVPLSAKTTDQLVRKAQDLLAFLRGHGAGTFDLRRIAYTLQLGREPMNERAAFIAGTVAELEDRLEAFIDRQHGHGSAPLAQVWRGQVGGSKDTLLALSSDPDFQTMIARWIARKELPRLADLWTKGLALDWVAFHEDTVAPRRIGLPVHPFATDRFWIETLPEEPVVVIPAKAALDALPLSYASEPAGRESDRPTVDIDRPGSARPSIPLLQLLHDLKASLAEALFMESSDVDVRKPFTDLGLDSIIGVEWIKTINKRYGTQLSATRVYDHPSVAELAAFLHAEIAAEAADGRDAEPVEVEPPARPAPPASATPVFRARRCSSS